jgi:hypothetical protein
MQTSILIDKQHCLITFNMYFQVDYGLFDKARTP